MSEYRMEKKHFFLRSTLSSHNTLINRKLYGGGNFKFRINKNKRIIFLKYLHISKKSCNFANFYIIYKISLT